MLLDFVFCYSTLFCFACCARQRTQIKHTLYHWAAPQPSLFHFSQNTLRFLWGLYIGQISKCHTYWLTYWLHDLDYMFVLKTYLEKLATKIFSKNRIKMGGDKWSALKLVIQLYTYQNFPVHWLLILWWYLFSPMNWTFCPFSWYCLYVWQKFQKKTLSSPLHYLYIYISCAYCLSEILS